MLPDAHDHQQPVIATFYGPLHLSAQGASQLKMGDVAIRASGMTVPNSGTVACVHAQFVEGCWVALSVQSLNNVTDSVAQPVSKTQDKINAPSAAMASRPKAPDTVSATNPKAFGFGASARAAPEKKYRAEPRPSLFNMPNRPVVPATPPTPATNKAAQPLTTASSARVSPPIRPATPEPGTRPTSGRSAFSKAPVSKLDMQPEPPPEHRSTRGTLNQQPRDQVLKSWRLHDTDPTLDIPF